jgi:hypothetical protein
MRPKLGASAKGVNFIMKTKRFFLLGVIITLLLATSITSVASADEAVVPFRAYYPISGAMSGPDSACDDCFHQTFTTVGNGNATHMGASLFFGQADAWLGEKIIQKGWGELVAANGDKLIVYYECEFDPADLGRIANPGWFEFRGGTGRFEGATGGGTYYVFVYMDGSQPNDLWFEGDLHR